MDIKPLHPNFSMPFRGSEGAGAYDIVMPEPGYIEAHGFKTVGLGFSAAVPPGFVALLMPRSGAGAKHGIELRNTVGVIDSDYRGEWKAVIKTKESHYFSWVAGDRLLQFMLVPVHTPQLNLVEELPTTIRGEGGFGSTGN